MREHVAVSATAVAEHAGVGDGSESDSGEGNPSGSEPRGQEGGNDDGSDSLLATEASGEHGVGRVEIVHDRRGEETTPDVDRERQLLMVKVRDVRVEFPYAATACTGDMERDDILQWLRRFRPVVLQQEYQQLESSVGADFGRMEASVARGLPSTGPLAERDDASKPGVSQGPWHPSRLRRSATWSCQYVEAEEFGLSALVKRGEMDGGNGGGEIVPDLCCAVSGVSVCTANYAFDSDRSADENKSPCSYATEHRRSVVAHGLDKTGTERLPSFPKEKTNEVEKREDVVPRRRRAPLSKTKASLLPSEEALDDARFDHSARPVHSGALSAATNAGHEGVSASPLAAEPAVGVDGTHVTGSVRRQPKVSAGVEGDATEGSVQRTGNAVENKDSAAAAAAKGRRVGGVANARRDGSGEGTRHCVKRGRRVEGVANAWPVGSMGGTRHCVESRNRSVVCSLGR